MSARLRELLVEHGRCVAGEVDVAPDAWTEPDPIVNRYAARTYCAPCPVRVSCFVYALDTGAEVGVWGGVRFGPDGPREVLA